MHQGEPEPGKRVLERGVGPRGDDREIGAGSLDGVLVARQHVPSCPPGVRAPVELGAIELGARVEQRSVSRELQLATDVDIADHGIALLGAG